MGETPPAIDPASPSPGWIAPVPNLLTGFRIGLAALFPFLPSGMHLPVVLAAGLSDLLDGYIARRFHAESHLGRLLDGIADKAFVFSAVVTLAVAGRMAWWEGLVILVRDLTVLALAAWCALRRLWEAFRHMKPRLAGKVTTGLAFLWFLALVVPGAEPTRFPLFLLAAASSVVAAVDYVAQFLRLKAERS